MTRLKRRPLVGLILATSAVGVLSVSLPPLAHLSYDASFWVKTSTPITNLVEVCADEGTLHDFGDGNGKISRITHAQLLNLLTQGGAKLVFYDFVFAETNQDPTVDESLAQAIRKQGSVILAGAVQTSDELGVRMDEAVPPIPLLAHAARGWGHAELFGNVIRQASGDFDSIPYAVWIAATNLETSLAGEDPNLERWLNYYGGPGSEAIPGCSFQDALTGNVSPGFFTNKIVFVGQRFSTGQLQDRKDMFETPYSAPGAGPIPGVEIHATTLLNLIRDDWLRRLPLAWQWLGAVFWGTLIMLVLYSLLGKPKMLLALAAVSGAVFLWLISVWMQWHFHWWWSWIGPLSAQTSVALFLAWSWKKPDPYLAFISYRTNEDGEFAHRVKEGLTREGYFIFIDTDSLRLGPFDEQLLKTIESATYFVLILSPHSLVRCAEPDDWVLKELEHALGIGKTVIPIWKDGFDFKTETRVPDLPALAKLASHQAVIYTRTDFSGFMRQLIQQIKRSHGGGKGW